MARYLNPGKEAFSEQARDELYVDKTPLLAVLNSFITKPRLKYVCVSRPRRFGKTVTAQMLCAYYGKGARASSLFKSLQIAAAPDYKTHLNRYHVIFISMAAEYSGSDNTVSRLKERLTSGIGRQLKEAFPDAILPEHELLWEMFEDVHAYLMQHKKAKERFVFVIDEWDCVMRSSRDKADEIVAYLDFIRDLFKDREYVALAYMTGILPIKKYGNHSALNMFREYSVLSPGRFAPYMGFIAKEVKAMCKTHCLSFEEMSNWYDGYTIGKAGHIFNPNSVVNAIDEGEFDSYWTRTETWEALAAYLKLNHQGLKDEIVKLLAGETVRVDVSTFENDMTTFKSRDDVLTLLTHLGYLSAEPDNFGDPDFRILRIPNREIQSEFRRVISRNEDYAQTAEAIALSRELLNALLEGDSDKVAAGVAKAHEEHASILRYNDENSLSCVLSLAFYSARDRYTLIRELPTGKGFADLVFIPRPGADAPALLIELKYDHSADTALTQIKERHYPQTLEAYRGNLILAGISYDEKSKEHHCVIERG